MYRSVCVCMYGYLGFWSSDFDGVKSVLVVSEGAESDSDVIEAARPMVDELWPVDKPNCLSLSLSHLPVSIYLSITHSRSTQHARTHAAHSTQHARSTQHAARSMQHARSTQHAAATTQHAMYV